MFLLMEGSDVSATFNDSRDGESGLVQVTVNAALATQLDLVRSDNTHIKAELKCTKKTLFRIENVIENNSLISTYTGFASYEILMAFFAFLVPSTNCLIYWGSTGKGEHRRKTKLTPLNQLFLTLIKLTLDIPFSNLTHRF